MSNLIETTNQKFGNAPMTLDPEAVEAAEPHPKGTQVHLRSGERLVVGDSYDAFQAKWLAALGG